MITRDAKLVKKLWKSCNMPIINTRLMDDLVKDPSNLFCVDESGGCIFLRHSFPGTLELHTVFTPDYPRFKAYRRFIACVNFALKHCDQIVTALQRGGPLKHMPRAQPWQHIGDEVVADKPAQIYLLKKEDMPCQQQQ